MQSEFFFAKKFTLQKVKYLFVQTEPPGPFNPTMMSWYNRPKPEDRLNSKPDDQKMTKRPNSSVLKLIYSIQKILQRQYVQMCMIGLANSMLVLEAYFSKLPFTIYPNNCFASLSTVFCKSLSLPLQFSSPPIILYLG